MLLEGYVPQFIGVGHIANGVTEEDETFKVKDLKVGCIRRLQKYWIDC